jgi:hypothetical protein
VLLPVLLLLPYLSAYTTAVIVALFTLPPVRAAAGCLGRTVNKARSVNIEAELIQIVSTINATLWWHLSRVYLVLF